PPRPTSLVSMFFFSSASWTSVLYTLSLHDALPIFVAVTVSISFSIVKVVLLFVRNQITQSVAIMTGDQIDRRVGAPITALKDVARTAEPRGKLRYLMGIPLPETTNTVAIATVPLCPARWKRP